MEKLKYTIVKTKTQYNKYCDALEDLIDSGKKTKEIKNEIELLTLLIETYDNHNNTFNDVDPITLLIPLPSMI